MIILPLLVFWKSTDNGFVWDDTILYLNKINYPPQNRLQNIDSFWFSKNNYMYAPITYSLWGIISTISTDDKTNELGANPKIFHLANLFLHIMNGLLIFLILNLLLKENISSLAGALIFSLHPIQVEAVAWVSELRGLLTAFFGFLSFYFYLKNRLYKHVEGENNYNTKFGIFSVLCILSFILSILSKPSGMVFPFIFLIVDFLYFKVKPQKALLYFSLFLPIIILVSLVSGSIENSALIKYSVPFYLKPLIFLDSISFYLFKILLPINLVPIYGRTPINVMGSSLIFVTILIPVLIFLGLVFYRKKNRAYLTVFLCFIMGFLPVSGLMNFYFQDFSTQADRYIYISMFPIALLAGILYSKISYKIIANVVFVVLLLFYGLQSFGQVSVWADDFSIWNASCENGVYPNITAYSARADEYVKKRNYSKAIQDYTYVLYLDPKLYRIFTNRGALYLGLGNYKLAEADFLNALKLNPNDEHALNRLRITRLKLLKNN